jgi:hypothetical protein
MQKSAVVAIAFACVLVGQPQPPVVPRPGNADRTDQRAKDGGTAKGSDNKGSSDGSSSNTLRSANPQGNTQAKNQSEPSASDWWIVGLTAGLVILAGVQAYIYYRQAEYMRRGLKLSIQQTRVANRSSIAAKRAADVAKRSLEVAYQAKVGISSVTLDDPMPRVRTTDNNVTLSRCCIEMLLVNTGSTVAKNFSFEYLVDIYGLEGAINPPVMISCDPTDFHPGVQFERISLPIGNIFPDANVLWNYVIEGRNLTVSGHFSYWDIFDNHFRVGYFARITRPPNLQMMNPIRIAFEVNTETNPEE